MAYIVGTDRNQSRMITVSLDDLIDKDNPVRAIDAYINCNRFISGYKKAPIVIMTTETL